MGGQLGGVGGGGGGLPVRCRLALGAADALGDVGGQAQILRQRCQGLAQPLLYVLARRYFNVRSCCQIESAIR